MFKNINNDVRPIGIIVACVVAVLLVMTALFGSWFQIDQTERGVVLRNGAYSYEAEPGLGFKLPIIDDLRKISVQTVKTKFNDLGVYSQDQQPTKIGVSIIWRVDPTKIKQVYSEFKNEEGLLERIIVPLINKHVKIVFGGYTAENSIRNRAELTQKIEVAIQNDAQRYPLVVESIQLEDITFSKAYEGAVEQRMLAQVEIEKLNQNAARQEVEARIKKIDAEGQANAIREVAAAEAMAIEVKGKAEAQAIEARGRALRDNPKLVSLVQAEKWDGVLPRMMLGSSGMPILDMRDVDK